MIWYCALFFNLQIFVESATFSCPLSIPTISYVPSCPKNKEEWENAAKRKQCQAIKQNCTESPSDFQYHCLLNQRRDRTLEVCAPIYYLQGFCGSYNFESKQIVGIYDEGRYKCLEYNGSEKCPSRYPSNEAFKYQRCYPFDDKNETRTALPSPPATTAAYVCNECRFDNNKLVGVVIGILFVVLTIIMHLLIWRYRERILKKICIRGVRGEEDEDIDEDIETRPLNSENLEKANQENEELKRKIEESRDLLNQERKAAEERSKEVELLKDTYTKKVEELQKRAINEDEIEKLQKEIKSLNDSLAQEKKAGEEKLKHIQQLKHAHTNREEKLQRKAVAEDEIEKLQKEIKSLKDSFMQEKKAGEEKLKEILQMKDAHTKTEEKLQGRVVISEDEIEKLQNEIKSLKDFLMQERKAGEEKLKENKLLRDACTKTEEKLLKELEELKNEKKCLERKIIDKKGEKQRVKWTPLPTTDPRRANEKDDKSIDEPKKSIKNKPAPLPPS